MKNRKPFYKALGLCVACGKVPPAPHRVRCEPCLAADRVTEREKEEVRKWKESDRFQKLKAAWLD